MFVDCCECCRKPSTDMMAAGSHSQQFTVPPSAGRTVFAQNSRGLAQFTLPSAMTLAAPSVQGIDRQYLAADVSGNIPHGTPATMSEAAIRGEPRSCRPCQHFMSDAYSEPLSTLLASSKCFTALSPERPQAVQEVLLLAFVTSLPAPCGSVRRETIAAKPQILY